MPPKRKAPTSKPTTPSAPPKARRSKLAKENNITSEEEAEIHEAFSLFSTTSDTQTNTIASSEIRRCLIALNAPPKNQAEMNEILDTIDPENTGEVTWEHFLAIAALKLKARHDDPAARSEEVERAYLLFTRGEERMIEMVDLRRVARELREEVPENVLRDMVREATGGGLGVVGREEFEGVMGRAGVFS
ncbi:hypothetical protein LTR62_000141 [Meristemomyces frigidus]|uniref:Calmodulin n=1 Tax=Meristemomyces frigidus TaxID=1508187 RepID=A0AAN7YK20_9PEZI|nr:hypothetical protein LTR62_000141 [Meristemomyces frigidus]